MIEFLLFLHILLFVFSFAFTAGIGILSDRVARTGDAKAIHAVFRAARPLSITGGIGWILTAAWLLFSYAAFAVLILSGALLHSPWQAKVLAASAAPGPELDALLRSPIHRIASGLSAVSVLVLLYLMIARPA